MSQEQWTAIDEYLNQHYAPPDPILEGALKNAAEQGLPAIQVSPLQGKFLMLLAQMQGAKRILEIGTLGGYSTIWLARALPPNGQLITLEYDAKHAAVANQNIKAAGLADKVTVRVGPALMTLPQLFAEEQGPFDFFFIDADKANNTAYVQWALSLGRAGSVIVVDNVIRQGEILHAQSEDPAVVGTRQLHEYLAHEPRLSTVALQTVGSKGHDGFVIAIINRV